MDDGLPALQREVQRMLGRCLLRLQQYEKLLKGIVANHEITLSGPPFVSNQAERSAEVAGKTLGSLVGVLFGTYVTTDGVKYVIAPDTSVEASSVTIKSRLHLSNDDYVRTKDDLRELVLLRNDLVHHFIDQHDLWSMDGCRGAQEALEGAYLRINRSVEQLQDWAKEMNQCRLAGAVTFMLLDAASDLAIDGWTSVASAERWIAERHSDQSPVKYGCGSWLQVLQESSQFELRYLEVKGRRMAWYRAKQM